MSNRIRPAKNVRGAARPAAGGGPGRVVGVVLGLLVGALAGGLTVAAVTDRSSPMDDRVARLRAEEARRDARQIVELTDQARRVRETLLPVVDGLAAALPLGDDDGAAAGASGGPSSDADAVAGWRKITEAAVADFADPPSAGTGVNIARSGLSAAVRQLDLAVASYAAALTVPEARRAELLALAGRQRDTAVATWSTAATQLDQLNVDAGHGHTHVFLPSVPGQGALTADGAHEGE